MFWNSVGTNLWKHLIQKIKKLAKFSSLLLDNRQRDKNLTEREKNGFHIERSVSHSERQAC